MLDQLAPSRGLPARRLATRYDHQSMHDMGFRKPVLLDRGYDPVTHGYDYVTVKSLDDLNTMLGI
ncbi:hypothetical protein QF032_007789 [Streptomyces achromogenes]|nr:hypothetical protein [Streptomyces achromogenes]